MSVESEAANQLGSEASVPPVRLAANPAPGYDPEQIRALRGELSRAAFAAKLRVTALTVYRWELPDGAREARRPRGRVLQRLRDYDLSLRQPAAAKTSLVPRLNTVGREIESAEYERLLPVLDRIPKGELRRAEAELLQLLAHGQLKTRAARMLATQALARLCVIERGDGRAAFSMMVPLLTELEAGGLPPAVELAVRVTAALVFSCPDGNLFDGGKTTVHVSRAERLVDMHGTADDRLLLWIASFSVAFVLNDQQLSERVMSRGQEILHGHTAIVSRAIALYAQAADAAISGHSAAAIRRFEDLVELADAHELSLFASRALAHLSDSMLDEAADPRHVLALTERARTLAHTHRHCASVQGLIAVWAEGEALLRMARFAEAETRLRQALAQAEEMGWTPVLVSFSLARLYTLTGNSHSLRELAEALLKYDRPIQRPITLAEARCLRALADVMDGQDPRHLFECFDAAEKLAADGSSWWFVVRNAMLFHVSMRALLDDVDSAERSLAQAERMLDMFPSAWAGANLRYWQGLLLCRHGRAQEGRQALEAALATFELAGLVPDAACARAVLARLSGQLGDPLAVQRQEESESELERLGIRRSKGLRLRPLSVTHPTRLELPGSDPMQRLLVPIQRLSVRGMTPTLIQRELVSVFEELVPGASVRLEEIQADGSTAVIAEASAAVSGQREAIELGDGSGRRMRLSLLGALPASAHDLLTSLGSVAALSLEVATLRGFADQRGIHGKHTDNLPELPDFVAVSPVMRALKLDVARLARSRSTVIITGESGSGKEVVAHAIHVWSPRAAQPFMAFNCAAIPRDLFEGQLFGYKKGAFTGATADHPGVIRCARGGTLFLDEVGELPLDVQPKLLRFLENGEIMPLGERRSVQVDVRVIAATNRDLEALVAQGLFREDLFYRLQVVPLRVPPLCERREDILALARHFLRLQSPAGREPPILSPDAASTLLAHRWPGNVRELRNVIERTLVFSAAQSVLSAEHLRIHAHDGR